MVKTYTSPVQAAAAAVEERNAALLCDAGTLATKVKPIFLAADDQKLKDI